jgi:hypothetical protein
MTIANQDFEVTEGSPFTLIVPLTVDGGAYTVPPGSAVHWWASPSQFDDAAGVPLKKSTIAGTVVVTPEGGGSSVGVFLTSTDTVGRGQKKLFHEARITLASGATHPLFLGTMTVIKRLVV